MFNTAASIVGEGEGEADGEAEKACAWLADTGIVDLVVTEDYDALVCGAPRVLRYWHHHEQSFWSQNICNTLKRCWHRDGNDTASDGT